MTFGSFLLTCSGVQKDKCKLMSNEKGAKSHVLFTGVTVLIFTGRRSTDGVSVSRKESSLFFPFFF